MNNQPDPLDDLRQLCDEVEELLELKQAEYLELRHKRNALRLAQDVLANRGTSPPASSHQG